MQTADISADCRRMADSFKQASDPTRLQILHHLEESDRNVGELCRLLGTNSLAAVSHHLQLLRFGRLVESRRSGKFNFYALTDAGRALVDVSRLLAL